MHSVYFTRLVQDSVASQGILVEYNGGSDSGSTRTTQRFTDMVKARRFYLKQVEAGNNPSIVRETQVATPSPADLKAQLEAKKAERASMGAKPASKAPAPPLKAGDIRTASGKATPPSAVKTPTTTTQESKSADLPKIKPGKAPLKAPSKPVDAPKASEAPKVAPKAPVAPEGKSGPLKGKVSKGAVKSPAVTSTDTPPEAPSTPPVDPVKRGRGRPRKDAGKPTESAKAPSPVPAGDKPARLLKGAKAGKAPKEGKEPKEVKTPTRKGVADTGESGIVRFKDLPWNGKKVALFKALKELKATSPARAVSAKVVMDHNPDLSGRDVRHYSYHAKAAGLIEIEKVEKVPGYSFYLTEAGVAINPDKELSKQRSKGSKADKAESQNAEE
jgi:hypothetical protein